MGRFDLFDAMVNNKFITLVKPNGMIHRGKILSIQLEDGSGYSFNLTMSNEKGIVSAVYYRCPK